MGADIFGINVRMCYTFLPGAAESREVGVPGVYNRDWETGALLREIIDRRRT